MGSPRTPRGWGRLLLFCWLWLFPGMVLGNSQPGNGPADRLTPRLFSEDRPAAQDGSGRTERLQRLMERHDQQQSPPGWQEQVKVLRALSPLEQLQAAHAYINTRVLYRDQAESWKTPHEAFRSGGVCVEFAVSKMLLLRDAGFPETSLRVVTLRPLQPQGVYHVILLARLPDGAVYVLDSPNRAQSATIVPLADYRERIRPVVWAGWKSGFSSNDLPQATLEGGSAPLWGKRDRTARFASGDRLVDIAADLRVVRPGERPLTASERSRLALLRRYYHAPGTETRRPLTADEIRKLDGIRARLYRDDGLHTRSMAEQKRFFFE
ncbi:MAG: transglutaminase-like cysteine peptidase [Magnetococcales bacterium]|nr:transglutaminase-like cysteine peptidase [Magnetococcales bacterium]